MEEQRRSAPPGYDKVTTLIETAVNYINKRSVAFGRHTLKINPQVEFEAPTMAAISVQAPSQQALPHHQVQQQQQQQPHREQGPTPGNCFKCNTAGHWAAACPTYPNQMIRRSCRYCQGSHAERCILLPQDPPTGQAIANPSRPPSTISAQQTRQLVEQTIQDLVERLSMSGSQTQAGSIGTGN